MSIIGGKVIDSGGFGCVFSPELKCHKNKSKTKKISKLMLKRYAYEEYNNIMKIKDLLKHIPKYSKYFVLDKVDLCKVSQLSSSDLSDYTKKCSALQKHNITTKNINYSLDKIRILNLPNAGISIDTYLENNLSVSKFVHVNQLLIELLHKAVLPMNKLGVFHSDLKASNILINETKTKTRIIDWGLSAIYKTHVFSEFPDAWKSRPLQFNVPIGNILISDMFMNKYTDFINQNQYSIDNDDRDDAMLLFLIRFVYEYIEYEGKGHLKYITFILNVLDIIPVQQMPPQFMLNNLQLHSKYDKYKQYHDTIFYIAMYLVNILMKYTSIDKKGKVSIMNYINQHFQYDIDVWGFVISYLPVLETIHSNQILTNLHLIIFEKLQNIFLDYLYTPSTMERIDIPHLTQELTELSNEFIHTDLSEIEKTISKTKADDDESSDIDEEIKRKKSTRSGKKSRKTNLLR